MENSSKATKYFLKKQVFQVVTWNKQCQIVIIFINISMVDQEIQRD